MSKQSLSWRKRTVVNLTGLWIQRQGKEAHPSPFLLRSSLDLLWSADIPFPFLRLAAPAEQEDSLLESQAGKVGGN